MIEAIIAGAVGGFIWGFIGSRNGLRLPALLLGGFCIGVAVAIAGKFL